MDSSCDKISVGNVRILYFRDDGKLDQFYRLKRRYPFIQKKSSVLSIECTEINCKTSGVNGLCISVLLNNMGWYFGVIGKIHNCECLIKIFTGKFYNVTPTIFNKTLYNPWYK